MSRKLTNGEMEQAYELLAEAIDQAGEEQEKLFLSKLCLTLAHELGDLEQIRNAIDIAQQNLSRAESKGSVSID